MYMCMYIYTYMYMYVYICIYGEIVSISVYKILQCLSAVDYHHIWCNNTLERRSSLTCF